MPLPPCAKGVHVTDSHYPAAARYNAQRGTARAWQHGPPSQSFALLSFYFVPTCACPESIVLRNLP